MTSEETVSTWAEDARVGSNVPHSITTTHPDNAPYAVGGQRLMNRYVFPGGDLPHAGLAVKAMQRAGLETPHIESLRRHCLRKLNLWVESFGARPGEIRKHIDDRRFRAWRVCLAGLAHAFEIDDVSVYQIVCHKCKRPAKRPLLSDRDLDPERRNESS